MQLLSAGSTCGELKLYVRFGQVAVKAGEGPFCSNTFKVSFYVPGYKQDNVPKPTSKDLFVEDNPKQTFYVSSYGGFALDGLATPGTHCIAANPPITLQELVHMMERTI